MIHKWTSRESNADFSTASRAQEPLYYEPDKAYKKGLFLFVMAEKENCVFCRIATGEIKTEKVYENDNFLAFPDAHPRVEGHTLVIPKNHFANILDMPASMGEELIDAVKNVAEIRLRQGATGFNLIQNNFPDAGQIVMHAHFHLIPRRKGDGINFAG